MLTPAAAPSLAMPDIQRAGSSIETPIYSDLVIAFDDDFQSDSGWQVSGNATEGSWVRGVPSDSGGARCDPPSDADGSGQCYVTGNSGSEDLDGGSTTLTSPILDASEATILSYSRWYSNGADCSGADPQNDTFVVEISDDNGGTWQTLEVVGPTGSEASGGWYDKEFDLSDIEGLILIVLQRTLRINTLRCSFLLEFSYSV